MNNINNFKSRKEYENFIWSIIVKNIKNLKSEKDTEKFLELLFASSDRKNAINRFLITSLIKQGKSYKEISGICWTSPNTISSIKKSLRENCGYKSKYSRDKVKFKNEQNLKKHEKVDALKVLEDLLENSDLKFPKYKEKGRWKFLYN